MKTLQSLLKQYTFDEILPYFQELYRKNEPEQVEHLNWEGYRKIYQSLQDLEVESSSCYICLSSRWEGCVPMIDMNCRVIHGKIMCGPVATYLSWPEIVGMKICVRKGVVITPQELVAGLLWEMTYFGGSEEQIKDNLFDKLIERVEKKTKSET